MPGSDAILDYLSRYPVVAVALCAVGFVVAINLVRTLMQAMLALAVVTAAYGVFLIVTGGEAPLTPALQDGQAVVEQVREQTRARLNAEAEAAARAAVNKAVDDTTAAPDPTPD